MSTSTSANASVGQERRVPRGETLLRASDVAKEFKVRGGMFGGAGTVHALNRVTLDIVAGETLGLVGESGCGKSTLGRCLVRLIEPTSGRVEFAGQDITTLSRSALRPYRRQMQMVFQDPYASLNPRRRAREIVEEPLRVVKAGSSKEIHARAAELLERVGLSSAYIDRYPHEFSGGQRQRIGIARALALNPQLVVADEPVSALDVSIQAQVLNLLSDLQDDLGLTYLFIAHDLGVVRHISTRIGVMYLGQLVELGPADDVYSAPLHPYTEALLSAIPEIEDDSTAPSTRERIVLAGDVPSPIDRPTGCPFHPRCRYATDECVTVDPPLLSVTPGRQVACHHPLNLGTAVSPVTSQEAS